MKDVPVAPWKRFCRSVLPLGLRTAFWDAVEAGRIVGLSLPQRTPGSTVLFYPEIPTVRYAVAKIVRVLKLNVTGDPASRFELAIYWEDNTWRDADPVLSALAARHRCLNIRCSDISKERVQLDFEEVFGYGLAVNPLLYEGPCVVKSNRNGAHDGRIIDCPIDRSENGVVYQRLIRTDFDETVNEEFRVPVVGGVLPLAYVKHIFKETRFADRYREVLLADVGEVFSGDECSDIRRFADRMGLDLGELDILRDRADGRIYVVDVNTTPMGPPHNMRLRDYRAAVRRLADAFQAAYLG